MVREGVVILILAMPEAVSREAKDEFEEFFREHYRLVFSIFAKRGCSREDCEDLTSETFPARVQVVRRVPWRVQGVHLATHHRDQRLAQSDAGCRGRQARRRRGRDPRRRPG